MYARFDDEGNPLYGEEGLSFDPICPLACQEAIWQCQDEDEKRNYPNFLEKTKYRPARLGALNVGDIAAAAIEWMKVQDNVNVLMTRFWRGIVRHFRGIEAIGPIPAIFGVLPLYARRFHCEMYSCRHFRYFSIFPSDFTRIPMGKVVFWPYIFSVFQTLRKSVSFCVENNNSNEKYRLLR